MILIQVRVYEQDYGPIWHRVAIEKRKKNIVATRKIVMRVTPMECSNMAEKKRNDCSDLFLVGEFSIDSALAMVLHCFFAAAYQ